MSRRRAARSSSQEAAVLFAVSAAIALGAIGMVMLQIRAWGQRYGQACSMLLSDTRPLVRDYTLLDSHELPRCIQGPGFATISPRHGYPAKFYVGQFAIVGDVIVVKIVDKNDYSLRTHHFELIDGQCEDVQEYGTEQDLATQLKARGVDPDSLRWWW